MGKGIKIVVTGLPEGALGEASGDGDFESLEGFRERIVGRFAHEEVNVLRHDDVAEDLELVITAGAFQGVEEAGNFRMVV